MFRVLGDRLYLGSLVVGLAWGIQRCVCSGCCFGGYGGLMVFLVRFVEFSFFLRFFVPVLVRVYLYPRPCMIYNKVPSTHNCWGPICTLRDYLYTSLFHR